MCARSATLAVLLLAAVAGCGDDEDEPAAAAPTRPTVYAATSLTKVMPAIDSAATYSFGASNTLQLQIERGAPADLFLSASPDQPEALFRAGRCERPQAFATNTLVLIVPEGDPAKVRAVDGLRRGELRLSIGNDGVPIGKYTRKVLGRLGLSSALRRNRVSEQGNVGQVLAQVALGAADAGFVYATDARTQPRRVDVLALPQSAQPTVRYDGCVVRRDGADRASAVRLLATLRAATGQRTLQRFGFGLPPR